MQIIKLASSTQHSSYSDQTVRRNYRDVCPAGNQSRCEEHEAVGVCNPGETSKPDQGRATTGKEKERCWYNSAKRVLESVFQLLCNIWNLCFELTSPQGVRKSYKDVIDVSWGDPHRAGVKPLSFVRQVICDLQRLLMLKLQHTAKDSSWIFF